MFVLGRVRAFDVAERRVCLNDASVYEIVQLANEERNLVSNVWVIDTREEGGYSRQEDICRGPAGLGSGGRRVGCRNSC
jgi:hypothetical protein